jgi:hypothetical protein
MEPARCVTGLLGHTVWFGPAFTVAAGLIVIVMDAIAGGQAPPGLLAVKVTVAVCAAISAAVGV